MPEMSNSMNVSGKFILGGRGKTFLFLIKDLPDYQSYCYLIIPEQNRVRTFIGLDGVRELHYLANQVSDYLAYLIKQEKV